MTFGRSLTFFTYATALWAFAMLAIFVEIHLTAIAVFLVGLALAFNAGRYGIHLGNAAWIVLSIVALLLALGGWFVMGEHLYSVVYLFLFLEINKLWTGRRSRDLLQVFGLTFFQVLAAAVSTASVFFAPALLVYLFLILGALVTLTIRSDAELAYRVRRKQGGKGGATAIRRLEATEKSALRQLWATPYLTRPMVKRLAMTLAAILVIGSGLFLVIPRLQAQYFLGGLTPARHAGSVSGFSDRIVFESSGTIQSDPTIIMRVFPREGFTFNGGYPEPGLLRLRGTSLDHYNGREWRRTEMGFGVQIQQLTSQALSFQFERQVPREDFRPITTEITLEPNTRGFLFGPERPARFYMENAMPLIIDHNALSIQIADRDGWHVPLRYRVVSYPPRTPGSEADAEGEEGAGEGLEVPPNPWQFMRETFGSDRGVRRTGLFHAYLQIPNHPDMRVVGDLAREWTEGLQDETEIAKRIEMELKSQLDYSLEIPFASDERHLSRFLQEERQGHCEYFATAMAMMLRSLGIPARIVNGYATDEWVGGQNYFLVRQQHAHSWVEANIPGEGWTVFDPTPQSGIGGGRFGRTWYYALSRWFDSLKLLWYTHVIDYDANDQNLLFRTLMGSFQGGESLGDLLDLGGLRRSLSTGEGRMRLFLVGVFVAMAGTGLWLLWREARRSRRRARRVSREGGDVDGFPVPEYLELLREVERREERSQAQTPLEYARHVSGRHEVLGDFVPLTICYYGARYNGTAWSEGERARTQDLLRQLRHGRLAGAPNGRATTTTARDSHLS